MFFRRYYVRQGPNGSRNVYTVGPVGALLVDSRKFFFFYFVKLPIAGLLLYAPAALAVTAPSAGMFLVYSLAAFVCWMLLFVLVCETIDKNRGAQAAARGVPYVPISERMKKRRLARRAEFAARRRSSGRV